MRAPTLQELEDLSAGMGGDIEALKGQRIVVWDDYISDGPGFAGKVAVILWSGGPECIEVYVWREEMKMQPTGRFLAEMVEPARHA
jgi:hypothetical protein